MRIRPITQHCQCQFYYHQLFQVLRRIWYDCMSDECMVFVETFNALVLLLYFKLMFVLVVLFHTRTL